MKAYKTSKQGLINWGCGLAIFLTSSVILAADEERKKIQTVSSEHVLNWALGLVVVLSLFFICVWIMRKMGGFAISSRENMRVISGLSLGAREKLILVQVGNKQLVLAVMPGKIEQLLVLEGDEQLLQNESEKRSNVKFSQQLSKFLKGSANE